MKALVVGLGSVGRRHARNWAALGLGELWMCRQTQTPQPEPLGVEPARTFTDLAAALDAAPDLAIVCNPTSLHVATARAAVAAGCHVLLEKPIGSALDGVPELLAEADAAQRILVVGYMLRLHPGLERMRALLWEGAIGRPLTARAQMAEYLPGWHPWEDYRQGYSARKDLGGGPILTFSHELDSLCWLLGPPTRLTCLAAKVSDLAIDTEDAAEIALRFACGVLGSVHVDYVRRPPERLLEIVGEEGVLRWEYDANRLLVYAPAAHQSWHIEEGDPAFERNDLFRRELRLTAAAVRGEGEVASLCDGVQGAAILGIALAAQRSAAEGRTVDLQAEQEGIPPAWLNSLASPPRWSSPRPSATSFASTGA